MAIRNVRRDAIEAMKKLEKEDISEDEVKELTEQAQTLTDTYIKQVDEAVKKKADEVMTV